MAASTVSVDTPRPRYTRPWCSTSIVDSPCASLPRVTLWTRKSRTTTDVPVISSIVRNSASSGPSPPVVVLLCSFVAAPQRDRNGRLALAGGVHFVGDELPLVVGDGQPLFDQRGDVGVVDFLLLVGQLLELVEHLLQLLAREVVAERLGPIGQRGPAAVFAEHQVGLREADVLRPHDFVRRALLEHAVLVDAGLVGEGVAADDRLVPLHLHAGDVRDAAGWWAPAAAC